MDTEISERHDLTQDRVMDEVVEKINHDAYHGVLLAPPCSTFSDARGGPGPLRGPHPPEIYGLKDLRPADKEK
eukprot:6477833-Heterocapsa_arctica.AAC.1